MSLANQNPKSLGQVLPMPLDRPHRQSLSSVNLNFYPRLMSSSAEKYSEPSKDINLRASTEPDETISERG